MKVLSLRPVPHECPRCKRMVRWALLYCVGCAVGRNPQYRPELDKDRIRK